MLRPSFPIAMAILLAAAGCNAPPAPQPTLAPLPVMALGCDAPCERTALPNGGEPWVAVDPSDGNHSIVIVQGGVPTGPLYHPWLAVASTFDGGTTWTPATPPGGINDPQSPFGTYDFAADVTVAFANDGGIVISALLGRGNPFLCDFSIPSPAPRCIPVTPPPPAPSQAAAVFVNALDLVTWRSADGGRTFTPGAVVAQSQGVFDYFAVAGMGGKGSVGSYPDREAIAVDRSDGRIILAWNLMGQTASDLQNGQHLMVASSSDGGATWTTPLTVASGVYGATVAAAQGHIVITARDGAAGHFVAFASADGGATWSPGETIGDVQTYDLAAVALWNDNATLRGLVAVPGPGGAGVVLRQSSDGGAKWGEPVVTVFNGTPTPGRFPVLALDDRGEGILASYQAVEPVGSLEVRAVRIHDGEVVGPELGVSLNATSNDVKQDYFGATSWHGTSYIAWPGLDFVPKVAHLRIRSAPAVDV